MSEILKRFRPRTEFDSYEDFKQNYVCIAPERFNFAHDVVDEWARIEPDKKRWCGPTTAARWDVSLTDMKRSDGHNPDCPAASAATW